MPAKTSASILSTLNLSDTKKQTFTDKTQIQRSKLLKKLNEQVLAVNAAMQNEDYFGKKAVKKTDDNGNEFITSVPKRVKKWFYTNNGNEWFFEVKYGNRTLQLAPNKNAIAVEKLDDLISVIDTVKQAVSAGELDEQIKVAATRRAA